METDARLASVLEFEILSNKRRRTGLDEFRTAYRAFIAGLPWTLLAERAKGRHQRLSISENERPSIAIDNVQVPIGSRAMEPGA